MTVTRLSQGVTVMVGSVHDQATLYSLLGPIRDLSLPLLRVPFYLSVGRWTRLASSTYNCGM